MAKKETLEQLRQLAVAFVLDEEKREDFVRDYEEQAQELMRRAKELGCNYELVMVPGGKTLQELLEMFRRARKASGHRYAAVACSDLLWVGKAEKMRSKDNFGIAKEAQLSAVLLNADDESEGREGLFFTSFSADRQIKKATKLMSNEPDIRYLTVAEYVSLNVIRTANNKQLFGTETFTRFLQYGWFDDISMVGKRCVARAISLCGKILCFDESLGDACWNDGVRFSVSKPLSSKKEKERLS